MYGDTNTPICHFTHGIETREWQEISVVAVNASQHLLVGILSYPAILDATKVPDSLFLVLLDRHNLLVLHGR